MRAKKQGEAVHLPNAELDVVATLYRIGGSGSVRQIREDMQDHRPMSHGAMVTILKRLEGKGRVTKVYDEKGRMFIYSPVGSVQTVVRPILTRLVDRVFCGEPIGLIASLFEAKKPSAKDLKQMEELLENLRKANLNSRE